MSDVHDAEVWKVFAGLVSVVAGFFWARVSGAHKRITELERETLTRAETIDFVDRSVRPIHESIKRIEANQQVLINDKMNKKQ